MKRLILAAIFTSMASASWAVTDVWKSSNTATADSAKALCNSGNTSKPYHGVFHGACVNTGAAGTLTIYNATGSAANPIAAIDTAAKGCMHFDVSTSSGLTYTNSATANVTMMYLCR